MEMDEMEGLRIQSELDKLRIPWNTIMDINKNSTLAASSLIDYPTTNNKRDRPLSRTLSNSLLDMTLSTVTAVSGPSSSSCKFAKQQKKKGKKKHH